MRFNLIDAIMEYKKRFYVYVYLDPFKKGSFTYCDIDLEYQPFYIGKGTNNRYINHLYRARSILKHNIKYNTKNRKINKIISIIKKGQEPIPIIVYHELTEIEAYRIEKEMIDHFGIIDVHPNGILYNYKTGGDGGFTVCEESKKKMSEAAIGRKLPQHVIDMLVAINTGKPKPKTNSWIEKHRKSLLESYASGKIQPWNKGLKGCYSQTEESNKKRSEKLTGVKKTKEHCKNISETRKRLHKEGILKPNIRLLNQTGENNHMYGKTPHNAKNILKFDVEGNFINEYTSMKKACDDTGTLYPSKLKEICGTEIEYKGFIFKYK